MKKTSFLLIYIFFSAALSGAAIQDDIVPVPAEVTAIADVVEKLLPAEEKPEKLVEAIAALRKGALGEAEKDFEEELKRDANSRPALHGLAGILFYDGNLNRAEARYAQLLNLNAEDALALQRIGTIALLHQNFEKAEEYLNKSVLADKENRQTLLLLGRLYALRGDSAARAISNLRQAFPAYDEDPALNFELGNLYYQRKSWKEASFFYDRAVKLGFDEPEQQLALAKSLYFEGKYEDVQKMLRRIIKDDSKIAEAHYFMGAVLLADKKFARAVKSFERADRIADGFADASYRIAQGQFQQGLYKDAMSNALEYRIDNLRKGKEDAGSMKEALELMVEVEKLLEVERLPHQQPGSQEGMVAVNESFAIDAREVSMADYAVFIKATGRRVPKGQGGGKEAKLLKWNDDGTFAEGAADLPVVYVGWEDALAYAAWAGKRLPTESEWLMAARGGLSSKAYPWGDDRPNGNQARYNGDEGPRAVDEGEPNGLGVLNIVGNVAEWCFDVYKESPSAAAEEKSEEIKKGAKRSYRGGHWRSTPEEVRVDARGGLNPGTKTAFVGFRCAKTLESAKK